MVHVPPSHSALSLAGDWMMSIASHIVGSIAVPARLVAAGSDMLVPMTSSPLARIGPSTIAHPLQI